VGKWWHWRKPAAARAAVPAPAPDAARDNPSPPAKRLSERRLEERALREGWALPQEKREEIALRLLEIVDPTTQEGSKAALRHVLQAARTLVSADLRQQALDLAGERLVSRQTVEWETVVADAERIALERKLEREAELPPGELPG
jgi:hypothetical protein